MDMAAGAVRNLAPGSAQTDYPAVLVLPRQFGFVGKTPRGKILVEASDDTLPAFQNRFRIR
jgi:hypothetical protein